MSDLFRRLRDNFQDEDYRHIYTNAFVDSKIATQLKVLREQPGRDWTQEQLAQKAGMKQARISALEDVNYSAWTLSTLRRIARAYDLYVDVEFKEFGTLEDELDKLDREHLSRRPFKDDPLFQQAPVEAQNPEQSKNGVAATTPRSSNVISFEYRNSFTTRRVQPAVEENISVQQEGGLAYAACSGTLG